MKYQKKNLVSEQIEDELMILDHETSRLIRLNHTAGFVWNSLKKPLTLKEIVQKAKKTYPDASEEDIRQCLKNLEKEKIIKTVK